MALAPFQFPGLPPLPVRQPIDFGLPPPLEGIPLNFNAPPNAILQPNMTLGGLVNPEGAGAAPGADSTGTATTNDPVAFGKSALGALGILGMPAIGVPAAIASTVGFQQPPGTLSLANTLGQQIGNVFSGSSQAAAAPGMSAIGQQAIADAMSLGASRGEAQSIGEQAEANAAVANAGLSGMFGPASNPDGTASGDGGAAGPGSGDADSPGGPGAGGQGGR